MRSLEEVQAQLERQGARAHLLTRPHAEFDASGAALVVTVGGDGTLLHASHNINDTPVLGVNSSPEDSVGFFCSADRTNFGELLERALVGKLKSVRLTRMQVRLNGRVRSRRVLNEALYCHASPAATSRYIITHGEHTEDQRSSGLWVGPAAGSTAAQRSAGGRVLPLQSKRLQLVVREPYVPEGQTHHLLKFLVDPEETVRVRSKMQEGAMFLDGPHYRIPVRLGDVVEFQASREPLTVLGLSRPRPGSST